MKDKSTPIDPFSAPIPGESLTMPKGSAPWERPPKFTLPSDALDYIWGQITLPKRQLMITETYRQGGTAEAVSNTFLVEGVKKGYYSLDLAFTIAKPVHHMFVAIGERAVRNGNLPRDKFVIHNPDSELDSFMEDVDIEPEQPQPTIEEPIEQPEESDNILGGL
jgi:hypothetical protein